MTICALLRCLLHFPTSFATLWIAKAFGCVPRLLAFGEGERGAAVAADDLSIRHGVDSP
jgi:hypothetical protein